MKLMMMYNLPLRLRNPRFLRIFFDWDVRGRATSGRGNLFFVFEINSDCTKVAARRLAKVLTSDLFFFEKQW